MITSEHSFQRCPYSSAYHHLTGEISPAVDIDSLQIMNTHIENTFLEYDNNEQKRRTRVAIIDFKRLKRK